MLPRTGQLRAASSRNTPSARPALTKWCRESDPRISDRQSLDDTQRPGAKRSGRTAQETCLQGCKQCPLSWSTDTAPTCSDLLLTHRTQKYPGRTTQWPQHTSLYTLSLLNLLFSWLWSIITILLKETHTTCTLYLMEWNQKNKPSGNPQVPSPFTNIALSSQTGAYQKDD